MVKKELTDGYQMLSVLVRPRVPVTNRRADRRRSVNEPKHANKTNGLPLPCDEYEGVVSLISESECCYKRGSGKLWPFHCIDLIRGAGPRCDDGFIDGPIRFARCSFATLFRIKWQTLETLSSRKDVTVFVYEAIVTKQPHGQELA